MFLRIHWNIVFVRFSLRKNHPPVFKISAIISHSTILVCANIAWYKSVGVPLH